MKYTKQILLSVVLMISLFSWLVYYFMTGTTKADTTTYQMNIETLPASGFLKAYNMAPGDKSTSILHVKNSGNLDFTYAVSAKQTSGATDLYNTLQLQVWNNTAKLYEGPLNKLQDLPLGEISKLGQMDLTFTAILPLSANNSLQGLLSKTEFIFTATNPLIATTLTLSGPASEDYNDPVTFLAYLTDTTKIVPISNATIALHLGNQSFTSITNSQGNASFTFKPNQPTGLYELSANFAGNTMYSPSNSSVSFTINKEETTLDIISSKTLAVGKVVVKAKLKEDGITPIANRTITFKNGDTQQSGITDKDGIATVTLQLPSNKYTLNAYFDGDAFYQPSSATQIVYVYTPTQFIIWCGNEEDEHEVKLGRDYVFWGAQWAKQVKSGHYDANPSFKGYADKVGSDDWTTSPGNSSDPPQQVSKYISVIAATHIDKNGSTIMGNIVDDVILEVDSPDSYQPNPGHSSSGVMVTKVEQGDFSSSN
ncbi:Ig-like domain (group 3) [Paenibacillus sp. yr247]|uniref:Ig-like domain-containing protein n=1 Tax=Paenibacillus sp. yr247 TaxID=1761880 RepID=UPI00087EEE25|nr:Ig-like domain-containing protein [Paenibacillus sp. yr247]SDO66216.1 Ig-like domain (group 3) [Paenibacillus sp. yr247]